MNAVEIEEAISALAEQPFDAGLSMRVLAGLAAVDNNIHSFTMER